MEAFRRLCCQEKETEMETYRKNAFGMGVLYIVGTVAGVLSVVVSQSILENPTYLADTAVHANQVILGQLFIVVMGFSLALVPIFFYPVVKDRYPVLGMGYIVFRGALETMLYLATVCCTLLLIPLSRSYAAAGMPDGAGFQAVGAVLAEAGGWITQLVTFAFILGALMFYGILFQEKLIPRWISGWGLITAFPYLAAAILVIFGIFEHFSTADALLRIPLGIQEMVLAVWLIVKGFNMEGKKALTRDSQGYNSMKASSPSTMTS
jgi:hypothetical protein